MKKSFTIFILIVVIAVSLCAFVACDSAESTTGEWYAGGQMYGGMVSFTLSFNSPTTWQIATVVDDQYADQNENSIWLTGTYYFEGDVGTSTLYITANETDASIPTYDPSSVRLLDEDGNRVEHGTTIACTPSESGSYTIKMLLVATSFGSLEWRTATFTLTPPQDGTMGMDGAVAPTPKRSVNLMAVVIAVPIAVVVLIAAIVTTVVLVKKNKRKKDAAIVSAETEDSVLCDEAEANEIFDSLTAGEDVRIMGAAADGEGELAKEAAADESAEGAEESGAVDESAAAESAAETEGEDLAADDLEEITDESAGSDEGDKEE